jgi:hypothetical protein
MDHICLYPKNREVDDILFKAVSTNYKADINFEKYAYPFFEAFV